jgi:radical SAM superfamily enzyme YgiQ (UPF0313 family)
MRVLLINPDVRDKSVIYRVRMHNPVPINLAYRAAITARNHEVRVVDENSGRPDYEHMIGSTDLVGITSKFVAERRVRELALWFGGRGLPVVVDGYYPTFAEPSSTGAASVIQGETEEVWERVLHDAEGGGLEPLYRTSPVDMARLPTYRPALLPEHGYVFPVEATRGCPFTCSFCIETAFHQYTFRTRPVADVIRQVELADSRFIHFADINIVGNKRYAKELFRALIPQRVLWGSQATITLAQDPKLLELAAASGCTFAFIGLESVQPEGLAMANKKWSRPTNYPKMIARLHDHGIAVIGSFILGFDSDGPDIFERTLEFVLENEIEICHFNPLGPAAGTPIRDEFQMSGRLLEADVADTDHYHISIRPAHLTPGQIQEGLRFLYTEAYSPEGSRRRLHRYRAGAHELPGPDAARKRAVVSALNLAYQHSVEERYGSPVEIG